MEPKKRSVGASERDEWLRAAWRVFVADVISPQRFIFVDEMGVNTTLSPVYGWSRKGERAFCSASRNRGRNLTLLASMSADGIRPCPAVEGATTTAVFETYVERVLAPQLRAGQVVAMDNLSAHKSGRVRESIEAQGCELVYLPAYSPDLNPIEKASSKVKGLLRKAGARTRQALLEAMGRALDAVTARDARGFFGSCGYRNPNQLL